MADQAGTIVAVARTLPYIGGNATFIEDEKLADIGEALKFGGLDFEVIQRPISTHRTNGTRVAVPGWKANMRSDTGDVLGIVGDRFVPEQNRDALGAYGPLVEAGARPEAVWSLRGGKYVGVSLVLPESLRVAGDEIAPRLILTNAHDGNSSMKGLVGPIRLRCTNMLTLTGNLRGQRPDFSLRHTSGAHERLLEAMRTLENADTYLHEFAAMAERLALKHVVESQVREVLDRLWPVRDAATPAQRDNALSERIFRNWRESDNLADVRETAWGVYNAAGEYLDHGAEHRGRRYNPADVRAYAVLFGPAMDAKRRLQTALESLN